jgi:5-methyltetrahydrofolate--homocysteine methyltransferase
MSILDLLTSDRLAIFLDGAMGTQLGQMGLEMGGPNNVTNPEAVLAIHKKYVAAGADLLITNTLTMNRTNLESHGVGVDVREVNLAGVRLAKEAAGTAFGRRCYVLGDMSSTGKMLKPYGQLPEEDAFATFKEQAAVLAEGGVDGLIVETMFDLREAVLAVRAAKAAADLPVIASVAFNTAGNEGRTVMGNTARQCAAALTEAGAIAVGANCGSVDPVEMAQLVAMMRDATDLPIIAQPNAGKGRMVDGDLIFELSTADFAAGVKECVNAGARLAGGCCGTSPAHIQAMVELIGRA